ncbi:MULTISPECIES: monovalent cation/H(+) antiporter subunit G [Kosmotoga]|jgi:multicomponent Na+:H+ antiporter subunit G|uniref:Sodium:proton antiporter n=1 Tax=Kosmotoga olearia (strain ATCC BAA-1733 / DSM 21960 / TBF 19.5.1) TaxID=521045 RepID=C5CFW6_KOSOT|nr:MULTISPECIES: monovalent cation/H(+) antiporter subunit G [Kosmotoga]ACR80460.1 hypothetical protein Kole_1775 [Kosmotoga olearia TBF 19.5.1]MDI3523432.1 multicomponent Na+:H+ antiporter subunit [Kosmotoga sp.]MDK2952930.1 multicomponent Na+:H+ antiporter subunit [Kosmotoga sp.]OAA19369.1 sodium:proton antiporter [Kosmotoga sp. DU53]
MRILAFLFFFSGCFLVLIGTLRAIFAHGIVQALHFLGASDTVGLSLLALSAFFFGLISFLEMLVLIGILVVSGPVVSHVISRAFLSSRRR